MCHDRCHFLTGTEQGRRSKASIHLGLAQPRTTRKERSSWQSQNPVSKSGARCSISGSRKTGCANASVFTPTRLKLRRNSTLMGNSPEICRRHYVTLMPEALVQSVEFDSEFADVLLRRQSQTPEYADLRITTNTRGTLNTKMVSPTQLAGTLRRWDTIAAIRGDVAVNAA